MSNYTFCVLIPTIRPEHMTAATFDRLRDTFTHDTDLFIMDGADGVAQTLNRGLRAHLDVTRHDFYVRIDDDWHAPGGWQDAIIQAHHDIPLLGLSGIDLTRDLSADAEAVMAQAERSSTHGQTVIREVAPPRNLAGGFHCLPAHLMLQIGDMPVIGDTKYQVYGSTWLSYRVRELGFVTAFVRTPESPRLLTYPDSAEYVEWRKAQQKMYHDREHELGDVLLNG